MDSTTGTVILLVVLAAVLALGFVALWVRDKKRADEEAHDVDRISQDPTHAPHPDAHSDPYSDQHNRLMP